MDVFPNSRNKRDRQAFTLIELLVVISIITLLISMLVPSLTRAREQARQVACASNLQGFGRGFHLYAGENRDYFCSGSFDPEVSNGRDGPVDKVGWVADLVRFKFAAPGKQMCPSNPGLFNQKLADQTIKEKYSAEDALRLIERGFNSNYTQSWYMARTEYDPVRAKKSSNPSNWKRRDTTAGPLRATSMLQVSSATVPLLGDGKTLPDEIFAPSGDRCVKSMTDGPLRGPFDIQSYSDFGPAHGVASWRKSKQHNRNIANILFADGHVDVFKDKTPDGEFRINVRKNPPEQEDLEGSEVFDGVLSLGRLSQSPFVKK